MRALGFLSNVGTAIAAGEKRPVFIYERSCCTCCAKDAKASLLLSSDMCSQHSYSGVQGSTTIAQHNTELPAKRTLWSNKFCKVSQLKVHFAIAVLEEKKIWSKKNKNVAI